MKTSKRPAAQEVVDGQSSEQPGLAPRKRPASQVIEKVDVSIGSQQEGGEEEKSEIDPIVDPRALKKPSVSLPVAKASKSRPSPKIVSTTEYKGGWKVVVIETKSGRTYSKWLHPDGQQYFFSGTKARDAGFEPELVSN